MLFLCVEFGCDTVVLAASQAGPAPALPRTAPAPRTRAPRHQGYVADRIRPDGSACQTAATILGIS